MISVVPQKAQLFAGTIRDNLMFGCPDATEEQIEEALVISQAKEFVDTKEGRLDAVVEQGGKNLSGGQRQRLTLASITQASYGHHSSNWMKCVSKI